MVNHFLSLEQVPKDKEALVGVLAASSLAAGIEAAGRGYGGVGEINDLLVVELLLKDELFANIDVEKIQAEAGRIKALL